MKKGFTMVELLVVLLIVGILAAVATPIYLANTQRARASEAVATMSLIRQAEREYRISKPTYLVPVSGLTLKNDPGAATPGLGITIGTTKYFSIQAYGVAAGGGTGASNLFSSPAAVNFLITATGSSSASCGAAGATVDCAVNQSEVSTYILEMDDSGRIFVNYGDGTGWKAY